MIGDLINMTTSLLRHYYFGPTGGHITIIWHTKTEFHRQYTISYLTLEGYQHGEVLLIITNNTTMTE